jgi:preprotein translocase subunit Sec63
LAESDDIGRTKTLNVLFMYNGHSFDAHEILGIPAGASLKMVEEAYAKLIRTVKPDSREFVEAAYRVLRTELKKRESEN